MKKLFVLLFISVNLQAASFGVINHNVTQENLKSTVCVKGWTSTIRPPVSYTNKIKKSLLSKGADIRNYELDHILPLSIGGAPSNPKNLMLQPWDGKCGAHEKDVLEYNTYRNLCKGKLTLKEAQSIFMPWECK